MAIYNDYPEIGSCFPGEEKKCERARGRKAFSFAYDKDWMASKEQRLLDPDIAWFPGTQYPHGKENFGMFLDSMPDTWGRKLMMRRAKKNLYDVDFLLHHSSQWLELTYLPEN